MRMRLLWLSFYENGFAMTEKVHDFFRGFKKFFFNGFIGAPSFALLSWYYGRQ